MGIGRVIIAVIIAASLISMTSATGGKATFYTKYVPSACYGHKKEGVWIAAANPKLYNNGAACGRRYRVRCTGAVDRHSANPCRKGKVTVRIVDLCPDCGHNQLDLSQQAFSRIADPDAGVIRINYVKV